MKSFLWVVLLVALPAQTAQAQSAVDISGATGNLIQQGALGIFCVLELVAIWVLYRQNLATNSRFIDMVVRQTEMLSETSAVLKRNETLLEKAIDRGALGSVQQQLGPREPHEPARDAVGLYRGARP